MIFPVASLALSIFFLRRASCASAAGQPTAYRLAMPRKLSIEEHEARSRAALERARREKHEGWMAKLQATIIRRPDFVEPLLERAWELEATSPQLPEEWKKFYPAAKVKHDADADADEMNAAERNQECSGRKIGRQSYRVNLLPDKDLRYLLGALLPKLYSVAVMRKEFPKGHRDLIRDRMAEHIEFHTGFSSVDSLDNKIYPTVGSLFDELHQLSDAIGPRGAHFVFPVH